MDLSRFFDRVNHDRLMSRLATRIRDKRVLKLIRAFLESGIMIHGLEEASTEGTPQGGPLSPLLSNIVLDELDKELERRGLHFVRYADDFVIYVRSRRAGERVKQSVTEYITKKLRLKVNADKSAVGHPWERRFLGFCFLVYNEEVRIRVHQKSLNRFKERVRELTARNCGRSLKTVIRELMRFIRGWWNYYGITEVLKPFRDLSAWIRRRLRALIWTQWKNPRTRVRELLKRGVAPDGAKKTGNTRKGAWRISSSYYVHIALPNKELESLGLYFPWKTPA
jgi:RNA-directed DNA polymerase